MRQREGEETKETKKKRRKRGRNILYIEGLRARVDVSSLREKGGEEGESRILSFGLCLAGPTCPRGSILSRIEFLEHLMISG